MKKILFCLALALIGLFAFAAPTYAASNYQYKFITLDNGMNGLWATDYFDSKVTITADSIDGCYIVNRMDGGTFEVIPDSPSPGGNGITKVGNGTIGTISGGITMNICGTLNPKPEKSQTPEDLRNTSYASYAKKYFHRFFTDITSESYGAWGWTFATCNNGTWVDNDETETQYGISGPNALMGDINGDYVSCPAKPLITTGDVTLMQGDNLTHIVFDAHAGSPTKGKLTWDRTGSYANHIVGDVIETSFSGFDANFVINITESTNYPDWIGYHLKFIVHDGGSPGFSNDTILWQWVTGFGGSPYGEPIVSGNLVVHN